MNAGTGALLLPESVQHEALGKAVSMHQLQMGGVIEKRDENENADLREIRQLIKLVRAIALSVLELQMQHFCVITWWYPSQIHDDRAEMKKYLEQAIERQRAQVLLIFLLQSRHLIRTSADFWRRCRRV